MTDLLVALLGLAVVHLLAVASPGPSTMLVVQTAAVSGRRGGLVAAFAMMLGALAWAMAALWGLQVLFARFAWLYTFFRVAGGESTKVEIRDGQPNPPISDYVSRTLTPPKGGTLQRVVLFAVGDVIVSIQYAGPTPPSPSLLANAQKRILTRVAPDQFGKKRKIPGERTLPPELTTTSTTSTTLPPTTLPPTTTTSRSRSRTTHRATTTVPRTTQPAAPPAGQ